VQSHSVEKKTVQNELIDMQKLLNLAKSKKYAKQQYFDEKRNKDHQKSRSIEDNNNDISIALKKSGSNLFENTSIPHNPISMIKSGIAKSLNLEGNLKDKNINITQSLGEVKLPKIEEYQKLIAKVLNAKKLVQMTSEGPGSNKADRNFQEKIKEKKRFNKKDENPNNNFLTEIKKIKRKPNTFVDDYSKRDQINNKLSHLNEFLVEKNVDKTKLNRRIDEYLVVQEKKIAEETCQNKINYEKELKKKNKVADDFKKRFINNLNDPSFNLEDEENSTKDLEMVEKSTTLRVQNSSEDVEDNYNVFKTYKDGLIEREKEKIEHFDKYRDGVQEEPRILQRFSS